MKMEQWIRAIAGIFILVPVGLGWFCSKYWLLFTAFVGLNLLQSAFTKWCLMEEILDKLGVANKTLQDFLTGRCNRNWKLGTGILGNEEILNPLNLYL